MAPVRFLPAVALLALALLLSACGGGGGSGSSESASGPGGLLLTARQLLGGTATRQVAPEACGPVPVLREQGGETAISTMFDVEGVRVVEAVGKFETPAAARAAFTGLTARRRLDCIAEAIKQYGSAATVKTIQPRSPPVGDESSVVRYASLGPGEGEAQPSGYSDVGAVRVGRCAAALLIAAEGAEPPNAVSTTAMKAAVARLSRPCG